MMVRMFGILDFVFIIFFFLVGCKADSHDAALLWAQCDERYDLGICETACNLGDARACMVLGQQFEWGVKEIADTARSLRFYERACHLGHGGACCAAAFIHLRGHSKAEGSPGVPVNKKAAGYYKERACRLGFKTCCDTIQSMERQHGNEPNH